MATGSFHVLQQETRELGASSLAYFHAVDASCNSATFRSDCEPLGHHYIVVGNSYKEGGVIISGFRSGKRDC